MKLKLYTASGAFIADCEVGGTEYPEFVRWGDRIFSISEDTEIPTAPAKLDLAKYREIDIPQVRSIVSSHA